MFSFRSAPSAFVIVAAVSVGAATFRVVTAPERVRERHHMAHKACVSTGGEWAKVDQTEVCRKADLPLLSGL